VPPGENLFSYGIAAPQNKGDEDRRILVYQSYVDADFAEAMGILLESGRFFNADNPADSNQYLVINQTAATALGEGVMELTLDIPSLFGGAPTKKSPVGIVKDFNFASFHTAIEPLVLEYNPNRCRYLLVRFSADSAEDVVQFAEKKWKEIMPGLPFDYDFMNERFAKFYDNEARQKTLIGSMAVLAISLAALGIFGTTLFVVQRRTKEVGIRKMLGSTQASLLILLARPAFVLVLTACAAGAPLAFLSGTRWLEQYPFRVDVSPLIFMSAFLIVLTIVAVTILYHFLRVTRVNPINVLRMGNE
jgi:putative ABC transport system permease protein